MQQMPRTSSRRRRLRHSSDRSFSGTSMRFDATHAFSPVTVTAVSADTTGKPGVSVRGRRSVRRTFRRVDRDAPPRAGKHAEHGHELGTVGGLAALSLDALSSVAYGPEAMMVVLATAGGGGL